MCCDSPSPPAAPDYSGIASANEAAAKLSKEAADNDLAFRKQTYEESKPRQEELYDLATKVANQQMGIADTNQARADEQWGLYNDVYRPNELQSAADAYGSQYLGDTENARISALLSGKTGLTTSEVQQELGQISRRAEGAAAGQAMTKAEASTNAAASQQARNLRRFGGDPSKMAAFSAQLAATQGLARAGAGNAARDSVRGQAVGLRSGVANFGRNMPNTAGQAFGLATQAGSAAVGNQNTGFMAGLPYAQFQAGGYGGQMAAAGMAQQGALGMGSLQSRDYATNVGAYNAQNASDAAGMAGFGQMAGMLGGAYMKYGMAASDIRMKDNIQRVGQRPDGLNLYTFTYKQPWAEVWGEGPQVGVMADEVEKVYPDAVVVGADGYKLVNYAKLG